MNGMSNNIKWNSVEKHGHIYLGNIKKHLQEKVSKIINTILFVYYIKCNTLGNIVNLYIHV